MHKFSLTIAAAALALAASSALADTTPPAPSADVNSTPAVATPPAGTPGATGTPTPTTTASVDPNAEVCKRLAPETGTRIGSRMVCKTNAQWESEMRQTQQTDRGLQNHMTGYTGATVAGH